MDILIYMQVKSPNIVLNQVSLWKLIYFILFCSDKFVKI